MSTTRAKTSSVSQGLPKSRSLLAGNAPILSGSYESIATTTVGAGGQSSITFSSIPSTYKHLQLRFIARNSKTTDTVNEVLYCKVNNDGTAGNYANHGLIGYGTGTAAGGAASSGGTNGSALTYNGYIPSSVALSNTFGVGIIDILDYSNTSKYKTFKTLTGINKNDSSGTEERVGLTSMLWLSTSAIDTLSFNISNAGFNFTQYSHFALYGIR